MEEINIESTAKTKSQLHRFVFWTLHASILFFKVIGLATFTYHIDRKKKKKNLQTSWQFQYSKLGIAYNIVLIGVTFFLSFVSLMKDVFSSIYHFSANSINEKLLITEIIIVSISVYAILLTNCIGAKSLVRIGNRLMEVERELDNLYLQYPTLKRNRIFRFLTLVCVLHGITTLVILAVMFYFSGTYIKFPVLLLLMFYVAWFMIQYFLLVSIIRRNFADVNRAVNHLVKDDTPDSQPDTQPRTFYQPRRVVVDNTIVSQLLKIWDIHAHLCDVSQNVSDFYSESILIAVIYTFFTLVFAGYYAIIPHLTRQYLEMDVVAISMLCWIFLANPFLLLTDSVSRASDEAKRTGNLICNLANCTVDKETKFELQQISLQSLHRKIDFTAGGYFTIDKPFFHSMIGAVTTYLIILGQIDLQN